MKIRKITGNVIAPASTEAINAVTTGEKKIVRSYRIDQDVWEKADTAAQQKHNKGVASVIEPLLKAYFGIK